MLLEHTEAELDFILEMYAEAHPNEIRFSRPGKTLDRVEETLVHVEWTNRLKGRALVDYLAERTPVPEARERLRRMAESANPRQAATLARIKAAKAKMKG